MFTSRAEYRILLRQDNADIRLTEKGFNMGLADEQRYKRVKDKQEKVIYLISELKKQKLDPLAFNSIAKKNKTALIKEKASYYKLLKRPELNLRNLNDRNQSLNDLLSNYDAEIIEQTEIQIKYETYIDKERKLAEKIENLEDYKIPLRFDYNKLSSLSAEGKEKLNKIRPHTIGQASRISGVSPSDISILMVYMGK